MSRIANVNAVFVSGKAIKSTATDGVVTWFYRNDDREYVAFHDNAGWQVVDRDTVERNVDHDHTTIETVDVDESPFGE
jgi:D-alanyl-D-alanine dipeptidase